MTAVVGPPRHRAGGRHRLARLATESDQLRRRTVLLGGLLIAALSGIVLSPHRRSAIVAAVGVFAVGLLLTDPLLVSVAAVPSTLLLRRLGGGAAGSSIDLSDAVLVIATAVSLPAIRWHQAPLLRAAVSFGLVYEGFLALSVLGNPNIHGALEWAHRLVLVAGSLIVGWAIGAGDRARQALTLLVLGSCALAIDTLVHAVELHFLAAQWGAYQKNYIGAMMWMTIVVAHLNPSWARIPPKVARGAKYLCVAALFASQSKQAIIALAVALLIASLRQSSVRRRSKVLIAGLVPLLVFAYIVSTAELAHFHHHFNSLHYRLLSYEASIKVWRLDIWLGQGPRWFYLPRFSGQIQPPNIAIAALASTGIIGLAALIVLLYGVARLLARLPREIGTLALVVLVGRVVESMFDIYWVSASGALPWLIAGVALGVAEAHRCGQSQQPLLAASPREA